MRLLCDRCGRFDAWTIDLENYESKVRVRATCECGNSTKVTVRA